MKVSIAKIMKKIISNRSSNEDKRRKANRDTTSKTIEIIG